MDYWINIFLLSLLVTCSVTDIRANKIPNIIILPFMAVALVLNSINNGAGGLIFSLAGISVGIAVLILPYLMCGMGAGDVKLMGAVGAFLGAKATFEAFILVALAGGVYSLALVIIRRDLFKGFLSEKLVALSAIVMTRQYVPVQIEVENSGIQPRLKYGVAIAFGTISYLVLKFVGFKFFA